MHLVLLQLILFVFPWFIRKAFLKLFFNFRLEQGSYIGFSIILSKNTHLKRGAKILNFNFINRIDKLELDEYSKIGNRNWITGVSTSNNKAYQNSKNRKCQFLIGKHCRITDRHFIDANGGIVIGDFTTVAGLGTQIISHGISVENNVQKAGPVKIGKYCIVGTRSLFVKDSVLPDYSVLAAGSVLAKAYNEEYCLYGGVPAKAIKALPKESKYFHRTEGSVK